MRHRTKKYRFDIESAIAEIEILVEHSAKGFVKFIGGPLAIHSSERLFQIIGESMKKNLETKNTLFIEKSDNIIALKNRLSQAHDNIALPLLSGKALKNTPTLSLALKH